VVLLEEFPPCQVCGFCYNVPRYLGLYKGLPERVLLGVLAESAVDKCERREIRQRQKTEDVMNQLRGQGKKRGSLVLGRAHVCSETETAVVWSENCQRLVDQEHVVGGFGGKL